MGSLATFLFAPELGGERAGFRSFTPGDDLGRAFGAYCIHPDPTCVDRVVWHELGSPQCRVSVETLTPFAHGRKRPGRAAAPAFSAELGREQLLAFL